MMKAPDRHLYNKTERQLRYVVGNKFMLQGDDINTEREPDERVRVERVEMKRTKEGLVKRMRYPLEMRWKGLWDKNSDKLYSLDQLLPQEEFALRQQQRYDDRVTKYRKKLDGAREAIKQIKVFKNLE